MLGRTFLLLVHSGRKTGNPHDTVIMVLGDDAETGELVICSGWGPGADWIHNLRAGPAKEVRIGRQRFVPRHRFLSEDEAVAAGIAFRQREHPRRLKLFSTILGSGRPAQRHSRPQLRTGTSIRRVAAVRRHGPPTGEVLR